MIRGLGMGSQYTVRSRIRRRLPIVCSPQYYCSAWTGINGRPDAPTVSRSLHGQYVTMRLSVPFTFINTTVRGSDADER